MTIQQAIEKAIEGGYNPSFTGDLFWYIGYDSGKYRVFLDPLFWQSLGKAMGWEGRHFAKSYLGNPVINQKTVKNHVCIEKCQHWKYQWHRFIDTLAEGKSPENFFKDL